MHTRYFQAGGLAEDIPSGFFTACKKFADEFPDTIDMYEQLLTNRRSGWSGRAASASFPPTTRSRSASRARCCGPPASTGTCAGDEPYLAYPELDFDVPVYHRGDVYDRYRIRIDEMRESVKIISSASRACRAAPWIADDRKVVLPPRHELHTSMESLIHHFKIVTEGYRVPEGEVYVAVESPARRVRLLPRLGRRAEAVARQVPGPVVRGAPGDGDLRPRLAGRRHDRDRRLARHRHGRG